ncbi:MAG: AmmeMemoRadiSam system protein B [Sulfurospirillaceae bacterium]|nr:AmmeMemoRadiSam system protein B [Sulfurospirillaceae bacterium]
MRIRHSAVSGTFYPDSCEDIEHYIAHFTTTMPKLTCEGLPKALIVPHAGYIYSGITANIAYHLTASKLHNIERVVVIGPSHRVYLDGASIALYDVFETPCANIAVDLELCLTLKQHFDFITFLPEAHSEHSTEVQMPFIRHYFPQAKIIECVYGNLAAEKLSMLIDKLLEDAQTLIVISTDLSHFYTQEEAVKLDTVSIKAISTLNYEALDTCEACGITGVKGLVMSALKYHLTPHFLDYCTSYERSKDASRVVGYASFVLT